MSLEQWRALGEDSPERSELQEGVLIMSPSPRTENQGAMLKLGAHLLGQVPAGLEVVPDVDVLIDSQFPPTVRRPDLVVTARRPAGQIVAADVLLVVEFLSTGTRRQDLVTKRSEYGDAGIPHYWIVDLDDGPGVEVLRLSGGGYRGERVRDRLEVGEPFRLSVDLHSLI